ncbi:hypothetical protein TgHK011_007597 [Trichoderma gracile]|nr:hypothetical protein TgHK011_007597 [Trichoderma gracile]
MPRASQRGLAICGWMELCRVQTAESLFAVARDQDQDQEKSQNNVARHGGAVNRWPSLRGETKPLSRGRFPNVQVIGDGRKMRTLRVMGVTSGAGASKPAKSSDLIAAQARAHLQRKGS